LAPPTAVGLSTGAVLGEVALEADLAAEAGDDAALRGAGDETLESGCAAGTSTTVAAGLVPVVGVVVLDTWDAKVVAGAASRAAAASSSEAMTSSADT